MPKSIGKLSKNIFTKLYRPIRSIFKDIEPRAPRSAGLHRVFRARFLQFSFLRFLKTGGRDNKIITWPTKPKLIMIHQY